MSPNIAFSSVDLPAPLGPMIPTSSPCPTSRSTSVEDVDPRDVAGDDVLDLASERRGHVAVTLRRLSSPGELLDPPSVEGARGGPR